MPAHKRRATRQHVIEIDINENYVSQLKRKMDEFGISQNALAYELGLSPTQVSRWFVVNDRRVTMLVETALLIERSILKILARRELEQRGSPRRYTK